MSSHWSLVSVLVWLYNSYRILTCNDNLLHCKVVKEPVLSNSGFHSEAQGEKDKAVLKFESIIDDVRCLYVVVHVDY